MYTIILQLTVTVIPSNFVITDGSPKYSSMAYLSCDIQVYTRIIYFVRKLSCFKMINYFSMTTVNWTVLYRSDVPNIDACVA